MTDARRLDLQLVVVLEALLADPDPAVAAESLGMTRAAMTAALARLRAAVGDPVVEQRDDGWVPTQRAASLAPAVAASLADVRRIFALLPDFDPAASTRTFLISASDYVLAELTSPLLSLLGREAPGVRVEFDGLPADVEVSPLDLLQRDVMIAGAGRGVPGKRASLFSDRMVCVIDAAHSGLVDGALTIEALRRIPHVMSVFGARAVTPVDDMLAAAGIVPRVAVTVPSLLTVPFAVAGTPWLGWVPERTAQRFSHGLGLVVAATPLAPALLVEAAHWHPSKTGDPALQWLVQRLRRASELVEFGADAP